MARTAQISKEKRQSIITLRHEGQSIQKMSRTLTVSSSPVAKTMKLYDETGSSKDRHRKGRPRVTSGAEMFGSNRRVFVRRIVGEQMISACVNSTVKHGGGGMRVLCW